MRRCKAREVICRARHAVPYRTPQRRMMSAIPPSQMCVLGQPEKKEIIMSKSLVIVESPAKAKTISKFLGKDFEVLACKGHIRALPSKPGSVDIGDDIIPKYEILPGSSRYLNDIKKSLKTADTLFLATDLDREGEAIAWHLLAALNLSRARAFKAQNSRYQAHHLS